MQVARDDSQSCVVRPQATARYVGGGSLCLLLASTPAVENAQSQSQSQSQPHSHLTNRGSLTISCPS